MQMCLRGSEDTNQHDRLEEECFCVGGLTVLMLLLGFRHVSPLVKLQKTFRESLEQPWLGSIQYSPAEGDRETP